MNEGEGNFTPTAREEFEGLSQEQIAANRARREETWKKIEVSHENTISHLSPEELKEYRALNAEVGVLSAMEIMKSDEYYAKFQIMQKLFSKALSNERMLKSAEKGSE